MKRPAVNRKRRIFRDRQLQKLEVQGAREVQGPVEEALAGVLTCPRRETGLESGGPWEIHFTEGREVQSGDD